MAQPAEASVRDRRRAEILAAAGRLFAERGIRETTVRLIADEVGVLSGSLYYYFKTKQDIVHSLMRAYVEDLVERYRIQLDGDENARRQLRRLVETSLDALLEQPHENAILQHELGRMFREEEFAYLREAVDEVEALYLDVIQRGIDEAEIRADIEPRFIFRMIMDVVKGAAFWYDPEVHDRRVVASTWWKVLGDGLYST
jgi:AcrR family transcriptional regulator